jgi:hypothetical protein
MRILPSWSTVELRVDDRDVQFVEAIYRLPIRQRGAPQRVHTEFQPSGTDGVHVHNIFQILNVRQNEILRLSGRRLQRGGVGNAFYNCIAPSQKLVGAILDPARYVRVSRAAIGRIVFETSIFRRVV